MITTNELRSGTRIKLANGWYGTLADNRKGNNRAAEVDAPTGNTLGWVSAHDIIQARVDGEWMAVTHTADQARARRDSEPLFTMHYTDETERGI